MRNDKSRKRPERWIFDLTPEHAAEIDQATSAVVASGLDIADMTRDDFKLPKLGPALDSLRRQFLHNHTALHDRTVYVDRPEPERRRHLLRLWLAATNARPLPPVYAECYGSVTPGDRGGIIVEGARLHAPLEAV